VKSISPVGRCSGKAAFLKPVNNLPTRYLAGRLANVSFVQIVLKDSNQPKSPQNVGASFFQIAFKQTAFPKSGLCGRIFRSSAGSRPDADFFNTISIKRTPGEKTPISAPSRNLPCLASLQRQPLRLTP
jgi:hypothetical protein